MNSYDFAKYMVETMLKALVVTLVYGGWIAGIVLAKGFWSTSCSVFFPPYSWYLCAEKALQMAGVV